MDGVHATCLARRTFGPCLDCGGSSKAMYGWMNRASHARVPPRWSPAVFALGAAILTVLDATWIVDGINPHSLRLDDQWVGVLAKHARVAQLFELAPPSPLGFIALQKIVVGFLGWG